MTETVPSPQFCSICDREHAENKHVTLDDIQRMYILHVYEATGHQKKPTARILNIDVNTLRARLDRYGS